MELKGAIKYVNMYSNTWESINVNLVLDILDGFTYSLEANDKSHL